MSISISDKGIVIRAVEYKEADAMLTILTEKSGKLTAIARGIKRKNSRLCAACQLLAYSEFVFNEKNGRLSVNQADSVEFFFGVRNSIERLALGEYFADVADSVSVPELADNEFLRLMLNSLSALSKSSAKLPVIKACFELKAAALCGYEPYVDECAACKSVPVNPVFNTENGAVYCEKCVGKGGFTYKLDNSSLAAMRHILKNDVKRIFSFTVSEYSERLLSTACERFLLQCLERDYKTLRFYKTVTN